MDELLDVVTDAAPFFDCVDDGSKVVVCQHHVRHLLRHVRSSNPHRDSDVGHLDCGRIIHAVARHRDKLAVRFERLYDFLACALAKHARIRQDVPPSLATPAGECIKFQFGDSSFSVACNVRRLRNSKGSRWMIAGHHYRTYACRLAFRDRCTRFFAPRMIIPTRPAKTRSCSRYSGESLLRSR